MTFRVAAAVLVVVLSAMAGPVAAQGRGVGRGNGRTPPTTTQGTPTRTGAPSSATRDVPLSPSFPQFGTWLDDATTAVRGAGYASVGASYWRGTDADQIDAPILGLTYGLANRVQLSAMVPFYRGSYGGFSGNGLDNVYVSGKIALVDFDAEARGVGVAAGAVAEILSAGFADASRAHWALPFSVEFRRTTVRLYGSTGYFSRGAVFVAGAAEWTAPVGTSFTASLAHSASVRGVTVATTANVPHASLRDASLFVSHPVSSIASVYVGGSRTFSETWIDGASSVSVGLSFRFTSPEATTGQ